MSEEKKYIHYCWFGSKEMDLTIVCCLQSWQKFFPEYEIMLWNENNFDVNSIAYTQEAYCKGKYAFVTDYVRLYALYQFGGIYFDTDYEVLRPFQDLIKNDLLLGFEMPDKLLMAMLAAPPKHSLIKEMLEQYKDIHFINSDGSCDETTNVDRLGNWITKKGILLNNTFQKIDGCRIFPTEYFSPLNFDTGELSVSHKTRGIHTYSGSWLSHEQELYFCQKRKLGRQIAKDLMEEYKTTLCISNLGIKYSIIITFYNNIFMLEACLKKLIYSLNGRTDYEIIVVNDNPNFDITYHLSSVMEFKYIQTINLKENLGYSGACNAGAAIANGKFYIFIDSDIIVSDLWLLHMEKTANSHPDFGAISANTLSLSTNRVEYYGMYIYETDSIKPRYNFVNTTAFTNKDRCCPIVTSTCMMVAKKHFDEIGGFDELLYNSHCDLDISLRLAPLKNYVSAQALVYHRSSSSGTIRHIAYAKTRSLFYKKWAHLDMNKETLNVLRELYGEFQNEISGRYFVLINFSLSTFSDIYIDILKEVLNISIIQQYNIKNLSQGNIIITDYITWNLSSSTLPIIYFCDQYTLLNSNFAWFDNRKFKRDLIADINGNIFPICKLKY